MNNITTPETAKALKYAGFPQPDFETGQFWYGLYSKEPTLIGKKHSDSEFSTHYLGEGGLPDFYLARPTARDVFAPTAMDILRELGVDYDLVFNAELNMFFTKTTKDVWKNSNPAEACAMAWLKKFKKYDTF